MLAGWPADSGAPGALLLFSGISLLSGEQNELEKNEANERRRDDQLDLVS